MVTSASNQVRRAGVSAPVVCTLALAIATSWHSAHAATAVPTLRFPANLAGDWLFNGNSGFTWLPVSGATYRSLVSSNSTFSGFTDNTTTTSASCNSSCFTFTTTANGATRGKFAGFSWGPGTYYWRGRATTSVGGAGAWTTTRSFKPTITPDVVSKALSYSASPASMLGTPWLTDVSANGGTTDGIRLRNAINVFHQWVGTQGGYTKWAALSPCPIPPALVLTPMSAALTASLPLYQWSASSISSLQSRIQAKYRGAVLSTNQATLDFLAIRAQCKEFVDRMMALGGRKKAAYSAGVESNDIRPGMYAFKRDRSHAAVIQTVTFSSSGVPSAKLVEANWASGWSNPRGGVPWERVVRKDRTVFVTSTEYRAMNPGTCTPGSTTC